MHVPSSCLCCSVEKIFVAWLKADLPAVLTLLLCFFPPHNASYMYMSPTRGSSFFLGKVTALGVLCCFALFVCLILLASFFLPSHLSFKNMYLYCTFCYSRNTPTVVLGKTFPYPFPGHNDCHDLPQWTNSCIIIPPPPPPPPFEILCTFTPPET